MDFFKKEVCSRFVTNKVSDVDARKPIFVTFNTLFCRVYHVGLKKGPKFLDFIISFLI